MINRTVIALLTNTHYKEYTKNTITLEEIFENWNGEEYDGYDWGELDEPAGGEMI